MHLLEFIMSIYFILQRCQGQTSTSFSTCANEKKVFKLDVRQRVKQLAEGSTVQNLDGYALCQEAFQYDYIWLSQLWTPSKYNYKNVNGIPQQTDDYRELLNIKEYLIDPSLGSLTDLYKFQQNVKKHCLHMKFLGEFAFHVPKDSYLIQNSSRFFVRSPYESRNIYSSRYDNDDFLWAMNDQMKTIPYAVPWNYFTQEGVQDMQDIIYRLIIAQHRLDGIVFLQPSLGLYQKVTISYYSPEIQNQGTSSFLKDFYENINLQSLATDLYFMGGEDNSLYKSKLLNYLQIVYNQPTQNDNWDNVNYTFGVTNAFWINEKLSRAKESNKFSVVLKELMSGTKNSCARFNYTNFNGGSAGVGVPAAGAYLIWSGYTQDAIQGVYGYNAGGTNPRRNASFFYGSGDMIEVQFEPQSYLVRWKKLYEENNQQASVYVFREPNYEAFKFTSHVASTSTVLGIGFPFMYSAKFKHDNLGLLGHRHIRVNVNDPSLFYYAQVEPSINQAENNFTLNFYILYQKPGSQIGLGVCDKDRVQSNNHASLASRGFGAYMLFSNGQTWNNSTTNSQTGKTFDQNDLISVTFIKSPQSIQFYRNKTILHTLALVDRVKNLNFCVSMIGYLSTVYLEY